MADESIAFTKRRKRSSLLQKYHDDLIAFNDQGLTPAAIARAICNKHNLPENTITGKQVSNRKWCLKEEARLNPVPDKFKRRREHPSDAQGQQYPPGSLETDPIREDGTRLATVVALPGSKIAAGSEPAHHIESETAITINDITGGSTKRHNRRVIKTMAEKTQRLVEFVESLSRTKRESLNNMMDIDSTDDTFPSTYFWILKAVQSYEDLMLSIYECMACFEFGMNAQIRSACQSQSIHLSEVAINMNVISKVLLLLATFQHDANSNVDAIRRSVANVEAYVEQFCPRVGTRTHFNSPQDADAALSHRVLKNRSLAEKYSLEILKQSNHYTAAVTQIDIANGSTPNHHHLPANDIAAAASGSAGALETIRPSTTDAPTPATRQNGSGNSVDYDELLAIEILKQGIMKLALTSAEYCDEFIKMNPPCSSS